MIRCDRHGLTWVTFALPSLAAACNARTPVPREHIHRVRAVWDEDSYLAGNVWFDDAGMGQLALPATGVLLMLEADTPELRSCCDECFEEWLEAMGVDRSLSPEEQDLVRIRDALDDRFAPRLRHLVCLDARSGPVGRRWCTSVRDTPLAAGVDNEAGVAGVRCRLDGGEVIGESWVERRDEDERSGPTVRVSRALDAAALAALDEWMELVVAFLAREARGLGLVLDAAP